MKKYLQEFPVGHRIEQVFGLRNIMQVVREDEPDNQDIDVEEQHGDLDLRIISGHISGEGYENKRNEQEDVNPEQM
jgi:hypothetical protein